jgi:hypothetical protein
MSDNSKLSPRWLLNEVGLLDGLLNEDKTVVVGRPDALNSAVGNVGNGPPATIRVDLRNRADWKAIQERLANEGI